MHITFKSSELILCICGAVNKCNNKGFIIHVNDRKNIYITLKKKNAQSD